MKMDAMELFISNAQAYKKGVSTTHYTKEIKRLAKLAEEGTDPCAHCRNKGHCVTVMCLPYYIYFGHRWGNIQRGYRHAMEG